MNIPLQHAKHGKILNVGDGITLEDRTMNNTGTLHFTDDLVGQCKTIGDIGPPYQVLGRVENDEHLVRIVMLESGREENYPLEDLVTDPMAK